MDGFYDLIDKYRKKIIIFLIAYAILAIGAYFATPYLIGYLRLLLNGQKLYQTEVAEGFIIRFEMALMIAGVIAFFVLLFIVLKKRNSKKIALIIISSVVLFACGAMFSYFVLLPSAIKVLIGLLPYELHISVSSFVIFCSVMMLVIGIMFEEPLVIYVLYRAGIIKPEFLKSKRRAVYITMLIVMAVITPSQDALTLIISMIPFVILYEGALLWISMLEGKKKDEQH